MHAHARPPLQARGAPTATVAVAAAFRLGVRLKAGVLATTELGRRLCSCPESSQSVKPPSGQVSESKTCFLLAFATARALPAPCTAARNSEQQEHIRAPQAAHTTVHTHSHGGQLRQRRCRKNNDSSTAMACLRATLQQSCCCSHTNAVWTRQLSIRLSAMRHHQ